MSWCLKCKFFFGAFLVMALGPLSPTGAQERSMELGPVADSPDEVCPVLPGSTLPDVTLHAVDGTPVNLLAAVQHKPTLLIVYRGGW